MPTIERSALVSFSCEQMYELVADFASYPQYMPGVARAELLAEGEGWLEARLHINRLGVKQSFSTRNTLEPPYHMGITMLEGPLKSMTGGWQFQPLGDAACKVIFKLDFDVKPGLAGLALPKLMELSASEQVDALCRRAKQCYAS
ncbi:type II toxin-antitoxin system RatA family toxin [Agaribacterium haliotis]|uniref:type II toxin-antitoxin system RatA family toxin n=1 Tax=Agaribacterium haliotis TaxID=2013869 RepID=UPI000BB58EA2|nr:type II toxin-antitoxin system RatA family toxin [Agaribacterium haliotis]